MSEIKKSMLFSGPMARAILEDRKTQTRRIMKNQPPLPWKMEIHEDWVWVLDGGWKRFCKVPHPVGSRIWVRETWRVRGGSEYEYQQHQPSVVYRASVSDFEKHEWRPAIFMPRWASRIDLEVMEVRVERLKDITEEDAVAEGIESVPHPWNPYEVFWKNYLFATAHPRHVVRIRDEMHVVSAYRCPIASYKSLWESINGPGSWDLNPFVFAYTFRRVKS